MTRFSIVTSRVITPFSFSIFESLYTRYWTLTPNLLGLSDIGEGSSARDAGADSQLVASSDEAWWSWPSALVAPLARNWKHLLLLTLRIRSNLTQRQPQTVNRSVCAPDLTSRKRLRWKTPFGGTPRDPSCCSRICWTLWDVSYVFLIITIYDHPTRRDNWLGFASLGVENVLLGSNQ